MKITLTLLYRTLVKERRRIQENVVATERIFDYVKCNRYVVRIDRRTENYKIRIVLNRY